MNTNTEKERKVKIGKGRITERQKEDSTMTSANYWKDIAKMKTNVDREHLKKVKVMRQQREREKKTDKQRAAKRERERERERQREREGKKCWF